MKLIQIISHNDTLFGLADDGSVFQRSWKDIPTGETHHDEYGSPFAATKRVFQWKHIEDLPATQICLECKGVFWSDEYDGHLCVAPVTH